MRSKIAFVSTLLLLLLPISGRSEVSLGERPEVADAIKVLDMWIERQLAHRDLPGLSIAVVFDQEVVWSKGYGFSDLERKIPATPATVYRIGSVTKLFTATAILHLRDQGKLRLDDPVAQHLPWFEVQTPFSDAPEITIRQLLTHTSGLPREVPFPAWTTHVFPTREQLIEAMPSVLPVRPSETTYQYSNLGISILGEVVTEVSGRPWADYVQEQILEPLGMLSSSAAPDDELLGRRATPYMRRMADGSRKIFDYYDTGAVAPAANMVSTVEDLSRFAAMQFHDGPAGQDSVLKGSTLREMQRIHWVYDSFSGGRGLGFSVSRRDGKNVVGHGGWIGGNRTHLFTVPSEKIAVIAALNADEGSPYFFSRQAYSVIGPALLKATRVEPEPREREPDPAWQRYLGVYVDPWEWEYEVMILGGDLVMYSHDYPPDDDASAGFTRLTPVQGHTFRMPDQELVTFELDADGNVERIKRRSDYIFPRKSDE